MEDCITFAPYLDLEPESWASHYRAVAVPFTEADLEHVRGLNTKISMDEVEKIYRPLARLLALRIEAFEASRRALFDFLGQDCGLRTYIIGLAGSVAVGKSTTSRLLQLLLSRSLDGRSVKLVTTDGFLYPNRILTERSLMQRKGFPESYDVPSLMRFITRVRSGERNVPYPRYSHLEYDVLSETGTIDQADVLILEGLNVLQTARSGKRARMLLSDLLDFSIYVDAEPEDLTTWFLQRFFMLRATAFQDPRSHFHRFAQLSEQEARQFALNVWRNINLKNLEENILPTRERAGIILEKGPDHRVRRIRVRKA